MTGWQPNLTEVLLLTRWKNSCRNKKSTEKLFCRCIFLLSFLRLFKKCPKCVLVWHVDFVITCFVFMCVMEHCFAKWAISNLRLKWINIKRLPTCSVRLGQNFEYYKQTILVIVKLLIGADLLERIISKEYLRYLSILLINSHQTIFLVCLQVHKYII